MVYLTVIQPPKISSNRKFHDACAVLKLCSDHILALPFQGHSLYVYTCVHTFMYADVQVNFASLYIYTKKCFETYNVST